MMAVFDKKKEKRFVLVQDEKVSGFGAVYVLADAKTGVQYLYTGTVNGGGLTPLIDATKQLILYDGCECE
ncbi:MAG: DUF6440 family protein [Lawsonibacter sp.]